MPQLAALGGQVALVPAGVADLQRNTLDDLDADVGQRGDLARIVGHQAQRSDAEVRQHGFAQLIAAHVGRKTEGRVGLDGIGPTILQLVGSDLVDQADAASLLAEIHEHAPAGLGDPPQRLFKLGTAIAALAEQGIAGQAFRMDASQHRLAVGDIAQGQGNVFLVGSLIDKTVELKLGPLRG